MSDRKPKLLALDFDGVICDGLREYFQVAWLTYVQVWSANSNIPPDGLAEKFYPLRAVIETGWEMPLLIRALMLDIADERILAEWGEVVSEILAKDKLEGKSIGKVLDNLRDKWIGDDLDGWLSLHRFYPGVVDKLKATLASSTKLYIITTKEGRFVKQLLQRSQIDLGREFIFGKEKKRPKYEILRELIQTHNLSADGVWFVEDRLKTLELVEQQADLANVKLYLANWGYNTQTERLAAQKNDRIRAIELSQFGGEFGGWV